MFGFYFPSPTFRVKENGVEPGHWLRFTGYIENERWVSDNG